MTVTEFMFEQGKANGKHENSFVHNSEDACNSRSWRQWSFEVHTESFHRLCSFDQSSRCGAIELSHTLHPEHVSSRLQSSMADSLSAQIATSGLHQGDTSLVNIIQIRCKYWRQQSLCEQVRCHIVFPRSILDSVVEGCQLKSPVL